MYSSDNQRECEGSGTQHSHSTSLAGGVRTSSGECFASHGDIFDCRGIYVHVRFVRSKSVYVTFWGLSYIIGDDGVSYIFGGKGLS